MLLAGLTACKKTPDSPPASTPKNLTATLAGSLTGFADGMGTAAQFDTPTSLAVDAQGNVYVADAGNNRIRRITPAGVVSTVAGTGPAGFIDGPGNAARFNTPTGVAVDGQGNVYVADTENQRIRKISPAGVVSTLAGTGTAGFMDGPGNGALFNRPQGVAVDGQGNVYVADTDNQRIRKISPAGIVSTLAGTGTAGFMNGSGNTATFDSPVGISLTAQGNVYVADVTNHLIRSISPAGAVSTLAGNHLFGFVNGPAGSASFNSPTGVAVDAQGNAYVADLANSSIRKISLTNEVTTFAGGGVAGFVDGAGTAARFDSPNGVAVDGQGNVYVADTENQRIRKIAAQ